MNCKANIRKITKGDFSVEDYAFVTSFNGQEIEVITIGPKEGHKQKTFSKLFEKKVKKNYLGIDVYVCPIEDILVHKADIHRDKDIADLELLKGHSFDSGLLNFFARERKNYSEIIKLLNKIGYDTN